MREIPRPPKAPSTVIDPADVSVIFVARTPPAFPPSLSRVGECVIADYSDGGWPYPRSCEVVITTLRRPFSIGEAYNRAATLATRPYLLFVEDVSTPLVPELFRSPPSFPIFRGREHSYRTCLIERGMFLKAGRWPEFTLWGGEGRLFYHRIRRLGVEPTQKSVPIPALPPLRPAWDSIQPAQIPVGGVADVATAPLLHVLP